MTAKSTHLAAMMQTLADPCFSAMSPDTTMDRAVSAMVRKKLTAVAVMDAGRLKGLVTRTDVMKALGTTTYSERQHLPLSGIMTTSLVVAGPRQTFQQALERMSRSDIEHLPVLHEDRLLTVLHESEILRHGIDLLNADIIHLEEYIEGLHNAEQD
jgi:predicted transcriptional regulator